MNWHIIAIVWRKEWLDSLRDRRTILSMIVIPVLVMPVLIFGLLGAMTKLMSKARAETHRIMIVGGEDSTNTVAKLRRLESFQIVPFSPDYTNQISDKRLRAAVEIPAGFDACLVTGPVKSIRIYHYTGEMKSSFASSQLDRFFAELRENLVHDRLRQKQLPEDFLRPFEIRVENVAPPHKVSGNIIGSIIPYLIIILCMTGAMYPAMDLTAGEKERGTMETLLCSPVARVNIVLGKFLTVLTAALATTLLALCSMGVSAMLAKKALLGPAEAMMPKMFVLDWQSLATVFLMVLPVAIFLSAAQLAIALFAKSFKEAQSYLSPLMIVIVLPAVMGMLPGMELGIKTALVPILNTSLICKEIFTGIYPLGYMALIFGSSCVYAAFALGAAVWLFNREGVLFRN
jgi:sodium transport system permease protein